MQCNVACPLFFIEMFVTHYNSPLGDITLLGTERGLSGLCLPMMSMPIANASSRGKKPQPLREAEEWLDRYFLGEIPTFIPTIDIHGTPFQRLVWSKLQNIPYGSTITYGEVAKEVADRLGMKRMSAQAIGRAVGANPVPILLPCHRVVGRRGRLVGYAGGVNLKRFLLDWEQQCKGQGFLCGNVW